MRTIPVDESQVVPLQTQPGKTEKRNRYQVGPGIGMLLLGISYIWWWVMPWAWESYAMDNRWAHNWAYSIIIVTLGLAWFQKTPLSRVVALVQALMMPITASGSVNTLTCTFITLGILGFWILIVLLEWKRKTPFLTTKMDDWVKNWIVMHVMILAWILVGHMGFVFFLGRAPFELQLLDIDESFAIRPGFLLNLPPELYEYATWAFDLGLCVWLILILYEQFRMGFNLKNKPWPRYSYWWIVIGLIGIPLVALAIQFA